MTDEELETIIGRVAIGEYRQALDGDQRKIREWAAGLRSMTDEDFVGDCSGRILEGAIARRFRGNVEGIRAFVSACYVESRRRHTAAGHSAACHGDDLYTEGFNLAYRSQRHAPPAPSPCTCGQNEQGTGTASGHALAGRSTSPPPGGIFGEQGRDLSDSESPVGGAQRTSAPPEER